MHSINTLEICLSLLIKQLWGNVTLCEDIWILQEGQPYKYLDKQNLQVCEGNGPNLAKRVNNITASIKVIPVFISEFIKMFNLSIAVSDLLFLNL